jgi:hypothetical protein
MNKTVKTAMIAVGIILVGVFVAAQEKKVFWDDDEWKGADISMKLGYLSGLEQGDIIGGRGIIIALREKYAWTDEKLNELIDSSLGNLDPDELRWNGATKGQMRLGIDGFYKDYANKKIPVYALASLVCKRVRGEISEEGVGEELLRLRANIAAGR